MTEDTSGRRVAAITGAGGGIGGALATAFAMAGWRVLAIDGRPPPSGDGTGDPRVVETITLDVTEEEAVAAWGAGLERLDLLVNAAGVLRRGEEHDPAVFARVVDVNLNGTMRMCAAARAALSRTGGSVINIASMLSLFGGPLVPGYTASKSGVAGLTRSLAVAWAADGIRVNAIAPGWIQTPMTAGLRADEGRNRAVLERTPMRRWGTPGDLIGPALFLASDAAAFVTGIMLPVDGGYAAM